MVVEKPAGVLSVATEKLEKDTAKKEQKLSLIHI